MSTPELTKLLETLILEGVDEFERIVLNPKLCAKLKDGSQDRMRALVGMIRNDQISVRADMKLKFELNNVVVVGHHWCHAFPVQAFARCIIVTEEETAVSEELDSFFAILNGMSNCSFGPASSNSADTMVETLWMNEICSGDRLDISHDSMVVRAAMSASAKHKMRVLDILIMELGYRQMGTPFGKSLKKRWVESILDFQGFLEWVLESCRCVLLNPTLSSDNLPVPIEGHQIIELVRLPGCIDEFFRAGCRVQIKQEHVTYFNGGEGTDRPLGDRWTIASRCLWFCEGKAAMMSELNVSLVSRLNATRTWVNGEERIWRLSMLDASFRSMTLRNDHQLTKLRMEMDNMVHCGFNMLDTWGTLFLCSPKPLRVSEGSESAKVESKGKGDR